jgi:hypothetical protein
MRQTNPPEQPREPQTGAIEKKRMGLSVSKLHRGRAAARPFLIEAFQTEP